MNRTLLKLLPLYCVFLITGCEEQKKASNSKNETSNTTLKGTFKEDFLIGNALNEAMASGRGFIFLERLSWNNSTRLPQKMS